MFAILGVMNMSGREDSVTGRASILLIHGAIKMFCLENVCKKIKKMINGVYFG